MISNIYRSKDKSKRPLCKKVKPYPDSDTSKKLQLKGDWSKEELVRELVFQINQLEHNVFYWPTLYFGTEKVKSDKQAPQIVRRKKYSWEPRPTIGQKEVEISVGDGTLPWD